MTEDVTTHDHEIIHMPLGDLQTWPGNPKAHDIYLIKQSYKAHGFVTPMVMDEGTGRLVAGHGRLQALIEMRDEGLNPPKGITLSEVGNWMVPVVRGVTFQDEDSARAYLIVDNQATLKGGWDARALYDMLDQVQASGMMDASGITMDEFEDMAASLGEVKTVTPDEEFKGGFVDTPEEQAERAAVIHEPHREVVILLLDSEHEVFVAQVNALKVQWGLDTLKKVILRAISESIAPGPEDAAKVAEALLGDTPVVLPGQVALADAEPGLD